MGFLILMRMTRFAAETRSILVRDLGVAGNGWLRWTGSLSGDRNHEPQHDRRQHKKADHAQLGCPRRIVRQFIHAETVGRGSR